MQFYPYLAYHFFPLSNNYFPQRSILGQPQRVFLSMGEINIQFHFKKNGLNYSQLEINGKINETINFTSVSTSSWKLLYAKAVPVGALPLQTVMMGRQCRVNQTEN